MDGYIYMKQSKGKWNEIISMMTLHFAVFSRDFDCCRGSSQHCPCMTSKVWQDFNDDVSNLGQMVTMKGNNKNPSKLPRPEVIQRKPKVMSFLRKVEKKKFSKVVWNSISSKQQVKIRKPGEQQGIKAIAKQQLRANSWPKGVMLRDRRERLLEKQQGGEQRESCADLPGIS